MIVRNVFIIFASAVSAVLLPVTVLASTMRIEGTARTFPAGQPAYSELHEFSGDTHRVFYKDPAGRLIAEKVLDYGCDESAPDWQQHDLRNGRRVGGRWDGPDYVLLRDDRSSSVRPEGTLVASSGFDRFVRQQWTTLQNGNNVEFEFALPARLSTIGMRIHTTPAPDGEPDVLEWFRVEPSSGLFRLFGGSILLGYDENRDLAFYRGPSNIGDGKGGSLAVEIRYRRIADAVSLAELREPVADGSRKEPDSQCTRRDA